MPAKQIPAQDERKAASHAILGLTAGISECVRPSMQLRNGRAVANKGVTAGQPPLTAPASARRLAPRTLVPCSQPAPSPAPSPARGSWLARPAPARVLAPASGRSARAPPAAGSRAALPSVLRALERRHPPLSPEVSGPSLSGTRKSPEISRRRGREGEDKVRVFKTLRSFQVREPEGESGSRRCPGSRQVGARRGATAPRTATPSRVPGVAEIKDAKKKKK